MPSSVRTYLGDLLVITFYMVTDYPSNQTLLPWSQYVVKLPSRKKYQEAMLCNDWEGVSTWYGKYISFHFVGTEIPMRTRLGN